MDIRAHLGNLRISPRKVRAVASLIRGLSTREASVQLGRELRRAALPLQKLLSSAVANAEQNFQAVPENLVVSQVLVNEGKKLKRWMPRAQGRATPIWKRMSEVSLVLRELDPTQKQSPKAVRRKKKETPDTKRGNSSKATTPGGAPRVEGGKKVSGVRASRALFHRKSV